MTSSLSLTSDPRQADDLRQVSFLNVQPPFEPHFFRFGHHYYEELLGKYITLPATGIVIVPADIDNHNTYINGVYVNGQYDPPGRRDLLAPRLLLALSIDDPAYYRQLLAWGIMDRNARKALDVEKHFRLPNPNLKHVRLSAHCDACKANWATIPGMTPEKFSATRDQLLSTRASYTAPLAPSAIADIEDACNNITGVPRPY